MMINYDNFWFRMAMAALVGVAYRVVFHLIYRPQRDVVVKQHRELWGDSRSAMHRDFLGQIVDVPIEEAIFRLWILLLPHPWNWVAIAVSSLAFAVVHVGYGTLLYHFFMGVVFAASMLYFGWWAGVVTHVVFNLTGIMYVYWAVRQEAPNFGLPCVGDHRRV